MIPDKPSRAAKDSPYRTLVLASLSPRRSQLLKVLGLSFKVMPSKIVERIDPALTPQEVVLELAAAKAKEVAGRLISAGTDAELPKLPAIVLGGDTIVVVDDKILGQPKDTADARAMLTLLSGRWHTVYTGVAVLTAPELQTLTGHEATRVYMRTLLPTEIEAYVNTGEPMDKAGAYALQGTAAAFIERIEGCFSNVIGLPIPLVVRLLRATGVEILGSL